MQAHESRGVSANGLVGSQKLVYLLNSYSEKDSSHFYHVINLLDHIASSGVFIKLVIETADSAPKFRSGNVTVLILGSKKNRSRYGTLFRTMRDLIKDGYLTTFVRISSTAAIVVALAHRLFGGRMFFWQSGTTHEFDFSQPISSKKLRWYFKSYIPSALARKACHRFVTGPEYMVDYYARVVGIRRSKIRLLYNDIDLQRFQPRNEPNHCKGEFLKQRGLPAETLVLLLVHRLSPVRKTGMYFPECVSSLVAAYTGRYVFCVVAGAGAEYLPITEAVSAMGLDHHFEFLGNVPNKQISTLYSVADIFIHPTYNEGFPRVLLEAMAAGLPVVTTDAGGTADILGRLQSQWIVSRDDPEMFSAKLLELAQDDDLQRVLGAENLETVKRFATPVVAQMYREVLFS